MGSYGLHVTTEPASGVRGLIRFLTNVTSANRQYASAKQPITTDINGFPWLNPRQRHRLSLRVRLYMNPNLSLLPGCTLSHTIARTKAKDQSLFRSTSRNYFSSTRTTMSNNNVEDVSAKLAGSPRFAQFSITDFTYKTVRDTAVEASILVPKSILDSSAGKRPLAVRWHGGFLVAGHRLFAEWYVSRQV